MSKSHVPGPNFVKDISATKIKDLCYKGMSKTARAVKAFCPNYFDGFKCWKTAVVGKTVREPCPDYVSGFDLMKTTLKTCGEAGLWVDHQGAKGSSTDYNSCTTTEDDLAIRGKVSTIYVGGYAFEILILVMALLIFLKFRKNVRCSRIWVHVNLFLSVIFSNIMYMTWHITVIRDPAVVLLNPTWCQAMHILTYYFIVSSHFWVFGEALHLYLGVAYLHNRLKHSLLLFTGIGWMSPVLVLAVFSSLRTFYLNDTDNCWTGNSNAFYIISLLVFGALFISFVLLLKVVYILRQKGIRFPRDIWMIAMIKATKTALVLTPLFAVHFYLITMDLSRQHAHQLGFQIASAVVVMLRGLTLAITFCFTNTDVVKSFRNLGNRRQEEPEVNIAMNDAIGNRLHRSLPV